MKHKFLLIKCMGIIIVSFSHITICMVEQSHNKMERIKNKGLRWYLLNQKIGLANKKQKNTGLTLQEYPEGLYLPGHICNKIAKYAENKLPLNDLVENWFKNIGQKKYSAQTIPTHIAYNPHTHNELAIGFFNGTIQIINSNNNQTPKPLIEHEDWVTSIMYDPHKKNQLISGSSDKNIIIWDTKKSAILKKITGNNQSIFSIIYNPHKKNEFANACPKNIVKLWDYQTRTTKSTYKKTNQSSLNNIKKIFDKKIVSIQNTEITLENNQVAVSSIAYDPHHKYRLACRSNEALLIYNTKTGKIHTKLKNKFDSFNHVLPKDQSNLLVYNPHKSNQLAATYNYIQKPQNVDANYPHGKTFIWDIKTKKTIHTLTMQQGIITCLLYNPHKVNELITGSDDHTITFWNTASNTPIKKLKGHTNTINTISCNPHNPHELASGSKDGKIYLWNLLFLEKISKIMQNATLEEAKQLAQIYEKNKTKNTSKSLKLSPEEKKFMYGLGFINHTYHKQT